MNRQQALQTLSENRNQLKRFSVKDLYLFGSVVRDPAIYILPLILLLMKSLRGKPQSIIPFESNSFLSQAAGN
jgi:hypothetical protein